MENWWAKESRPEVVQVLAISQLTRKCVPWKLGHGARCGPPTGLPVGRDPVPQHNLLGPSGVLQSRRACCLGAYHCQ